MSQYILFDAALCARFAEFLASRGIRHDVRPDRMEGYAIAIPDDLPEDVEDAIEEAYDALMDEQQELVDAVEGREGGRTLMTVPIVLPDGQPLEIHLPALYARRLHEHFTVDEIRDLVTLIAHGVAEPSRGPACCQP